MAITPLTTGDIVRFGIKDYRVSIDTDGSPCFIETNPLPTRPGIYTIKEPGFNAAYMRLIRLDDGTWLRLDLSTGKTFTDDEFNGRTGSWTGAKDVAELAHRAGTLSLAHARDDYRDNR